MSTRADDLAVAQNLWAVCCGRCGKLNRHSVVAEIGHCEHCGHRFSELRLLTKQEARGFLRGKFEGTVTIDNKDRLHDVFNGIEDLPTAYLDYNRPRIKAMEKLQAQRIARRRAGRVREEKYVIPRIGKALRRIERFLRAKTKR